MTRFPAPILGAAVLALLALPFAIADEVPTRGIGVYPGDPAEDFSPSLVPAPAGRRNLALHRAVTQSSAYDYNLVAQLATDGIVEATMPRWLAVTTGSGSPPPKSEQAFVVDDNKFSGIDLYAPGWIGVELGGGGEPFEIDRVRDRAAPAELAVVGVPGGLRAAGRATGPLPGRPGAADPAARGRICRERDGRRPRVESGRLSGRSRLADARPRDDAGSWR